ncbi:hypothetical protein I302_101514 [Kwoniella bestiolae CBS 10118]|uniref:Uncharacterized protein n=1 Tax=Kwoniella bestiolae CBS 10118 TaxID=1296100 RepID=A0A1B9GCG4_9TREE|nr:hypothetical protein I302_00198 [Kwoniella bestiolae CBS 10118]OCF28709.1 hypothetical protein I302_00198 [Kwoniella bestiolae CBS 10118]
MSTQVQIASTPISDSFLSAKAQSSRRAPAFDNSMNGSKSRRGSTLAVVPENHSHDHDQPSTSSSSSVPTPATNVPQQKKSTRRTASSTSSSSNTTGDLREMDKELEMKMRRSHSSTNTSASSEKGKSRESQRSRSKRADWVIDLLETQKGAETWIDDQRVILVLGDPTPASLAPILYDPAFSDTLLLVGTYTPIPEIEALLSPSHLMSSTPDQQIFPTVQPFTPSIQSGDTDSHALTVLLSQATTLAQQFRAKSSIFARSRAESFASIGSNPSNSPKRKFVGLSNTSSNRSSLESTHSSSNDKSQQQQHQRAVSMYDTSSNDSTPKAKNRLSTFSILGGLRRNSDSSDINPSMPGSSSTSSSSTKDNLFDAIVNFVPDMKNFKPERSLQDMLHQSVVITTGIIPLLTAKSLSTSSSSKQRGTMPISIIHVLPKIMPSPLPNVIESFLLSLLPTFQYRCPREIFGCVVTTQTWLSPFVIQGGGEEDVSGAQVLLFGGLRCPYQVLDEEERCKPRAFLAGWSGCLNMPGLINESRNPASSGTKVAQYKQERERHLSSPSPASIPYDSVKARTPPHSRPSSPNKGKLPRSASMPISSSSGGKPRRSKLHVSHTPPMMSDGELPDNDQDDAASASGGSPSTPDLDSSPSVESSRASSIGLGSRRGSEIEEVKIVNSQTQTGGSDGSHEGGGGGGGMDRKTRGKLKSWFKRR